MSKKRSKTPSTSRLSARKTTAPKLLTRDAPEAAAVVESAPVAPVAPDRKLIARRAFAKFVARGYVHGHHVEDWLAAEAELVAS